MMIGLAMDAGSSKAGKAFSGLMKDLNDRFDSLSEEDYSLHGVAELVFTLRASGEVADFGFEGCDRLRKRKERVTIDIGIPVGAWERSSVAERAALLVTHVGEAVRLCANRLRNEERGGDVDRFESDAHQALAEFRSGLV